MKQMMDVETARSSRPALEDGLPAGSKTMLRRSARNRGSETPAAQPALVTEDGPAGHQPDLEVDPGPTPQTRRTAASAAAGTKLAATSMRRPGISRCKASAILKSNAVLQMEIRYEQVQLRKPGPRAHLEVIWRCSSPP